MGDLRLTDKSIIEELQLKGLYHFVILDGSCSNESISLQVFENEKYRPVLLEWGSAKGIHIFPPWDRNPFTDDIGKYSIRSDLSEINPIKGFKWSNDWTLVVKEGVSDENGFRYAMNWASLNSQSPLSNKMSRLSFVRRREWVRTMVVDPDPPQKTLPFVLDIRIMNLLVKNLTTTSTQEAHVELYFDDDLYSTTYLSPSQGSSSTSTSSLTGSSATNNTGMVVKYLHSLNPNMKITFLVYKKQLGSTQLAASGKVEMLLGHLIEDKDKDMAVLDYPLHYSSNYRDRFLQLGIALREQKLFSIAKEVARKTSSSGTETSVVEFTLSPRLKDKIIILSLAIGSNCNVLLDDIVGFLSEAAEFISELDIMDILDDMNQMNRRSEFSKLITLLRESDDPLRSITRYPAFKNDWCVYSKVMTFLGGSTEGIQPHLSDIDTRNKQLLTLQPLYCRDYCPGFFKQGTDSPEAAYMTQGVGRFRVVFFCSGDFVHEFYWTNYYDYIQVLKMLSILKYHTQHAMKGGDYFTAVDQSSWNVQLNAGPYNSMDQARVRSCAAVQLVFDAGTILSTMLSTMLSTHALHHALYHAAQATHTAVNLFHCPLYVPTTLLYVVSFGFNADIVEQVGDPSYAPLDPFFIPFDEVMISNISTPI